MRQAAINVQRSVCLNCSTKNDTFVFVGGMFAIARRSQYMRLALEKMHIGQSQLIKMLCKDDDAKTLRLDGKKR